MRFDQVGETGNRRQQFGQFNELCQVCPVSNAKCASAIFGPRVLPPNELVVQAF